MVQKEEAGSLESDRVSAKRTRMPADVRQVLVVVVEAVLVATVVTVVVSEVQDISCLISSF